ncbi:MAG: sulfate reduction electron transfer complex DsrMKJOP subunit DsrM [Pseudomonadota bacterium]
MSALASIMFSLFTIILCFFVVLLGVEAVSLHYLFGVIIPYVALITFIGGFIYRILHWAKSPVPFRITTTCGQQKSLPWIKANSLENPHTTFDVLKRMVLEVLFFRSLFRNTSAELKDGPKIVYWSAKWLWLAGLAFHWSFLIIVTRHLRFFTEPIPFFVQLIENIDGAFEIGVPTLFLTDLVILAALTHLFCRRVLVLRIRYISLPADYFPLLLLLGIVFTGVLMRSFEAFKVDLIKVKELAIGLLSFHPVIPEGIGFLFYVHLFFVCVLLVYFPFSKLMHMGGVFLSPTRNLANTNRIQRHINPWNYPVKVHHYEEYEEEFREKMKMAGIPVEKE